MSDFYSILKSKNYPIFYVQSDSSGPRTTGRPTHDYDVHP